MELGSRILYCDEQCVVVNKLCGEAVEGAAPGMADLPDMLARYFNSIESVSKQSLRGNSALLNLPAAVNRLDVPVTGCALFARTQDALVFLNSVFAENFSAGLKNEHNNSKFAEKHYWAIIEKPEKEFLPEARLVHWIAFDTKRNKSVAYDEPGQDRKKAVLEYHVAGTGQNYIFLEIQLFTGRHHQIRCQFEKIGLHIKGDLKYGARRSEKAGGIRLHARSLDFPNPKVFSASADSEFHRERISVKCDPPLCDNLWQAFTAIA